MSIVFHSISKSEIEKEMLNPESSNTRQDSEITTKIIKFNSDIFAEAVYFEFSRSLETGIFHQ